MGKRKRKAQRQGKEQDKQRAKETWLLRTAWKSIRSIELYACRARWWSHPLVAAGSDERLALSGRRIQDVQHAVLARFSPAATGSFNRDDAISPRAPAKGCQLAGKCSNKVENTASPRLISVCESVHAVQRKGKLNKKRTQFTLPSTLLLHPCSTDLWKNAKRRSEVLLLTLHTPQKWNFSFWRMTCHSSFRSCCRWCDSECSDMTVCHWVNQGWLRSD